MNNEIVLVENGVFPLVKDLQNQLIPNDTDWNFSGTFQGEGKWSGIPCLFVRLTACNLRCSFANSICDTAYSSFHPEKNKMLISDVVKLIEINNSDRRINHIIISGGEPTMQIEPLIELMIQLKKLNYSITVETNGTIYDQRFSELIDLVSMSPKLSSSNPTKEVLEENGQSINWVEKHEKLRKRLDVIQSFITNSKLYSNDFQLKFVVTCEKDIAEIKVWLSELVGFDNIDILLMPAGTTEEQLCEMNKVVAKLAVKYGYRFSPRLHVDVFGSAKKGV